jgi:hypothetical protein
MVEHRRPRPKHRTSQHDQLPRYDQALRAAKNAGKRVTFDLAVETDFAPDCTVEGLVLEVDRFSIQIEMLSGKKPWIAKAFIVGTEVLA